ncbi:MAG TPA: phytanoyl-CoA dioxygenase family protein [Pyrinomonadaceae bacterium]
MPLTAQQHETYRRKGYVTLRGLFAPDEVTNWAAESARLLALGIANKDNLRTHPHYITENCWIVDRYDPVIDISDVFRKLASDSRIRDVMAQILGDDVFLFKDRLIYKMLGMPGYPIHQDYSWWQEFPEDLVNVAIAIDGADAENGALELFPGYRHLLSAPGEMRHMNEAEAQQIELGEGELMTTQPGDVVIFGCMTPHRSGPNLSNRTRRQFYVTYSAARHGDLYNRQLELFKEGRSSKRLSAEQKARAFFR